MLGRDERLGQVFRNLVDNAVSFSPDRRNGDDRRDAQRAASRTHHRRRRRPRHPAGKSRNHLQAFLYRAAARPRFRQELGSWSFDRAADRRRRRAAASGRRTASDGGARFIVELPLAARDETAVNIHATCVRARRSRLRFRRAGERRRSASRRERRGQIGSRAAADGRGRELVADDRDGSCSIRTAGCTARAPSRIAGLIEVRGVGIVETAACGKRAHRTGRAISAQRYARMPDAGHYAAAGAAAVWRKSAAACYRSAGFEDSAPDKIAGGRRGTLHNALFREEVKPN